MGGARKEAEQLSVSPGNKRTEETSPEAALLKESRPADEHKQAQQKHANTSKHSNNSSTNVMVFPSRG